MKNTLKIANLVSGIIYSMFFLALFIEALMTKDATLVKGIIFIAPCIIINWLSWKEFSK